jgi:hypothetical protein
VPFMKTSYTSIYLFNPGDQDLEVEMGFVCTSCDGDIPVDQFGLRTSPERVVIPRNTSMYNPKEIHIVARNPTLVKRYLSFDAFGKAVRIPFYTLAIAGRSIEGRFTARTLNSKVSIVVTSKVDMEMGGIGWWRIAFLAALVASFIVLKTYNRPRKAKKAEK